jgi:hypothetical protein
MHMDFMMHPAGGRRNQQVASNDSHFYLVYGGGYDSYWVDISSGMNDTQVRGTVYCLLCCAVLCCAVLCCAALAALRCAVLYKLNMSHIMIECCVVDPLACHDSVE